MPQEAAINELSTTAGNGTKRPITRSNPLCSGAHAACSPTEVLVIRLMMTNELLQRRQISRLDGFEQPEALAKHTVQLWEAMATELIPLIGEEGFTILYNRSLYLTQLDFLWLAAGQVAQPGEWHFTALLKSLEERPVIEAAASSKALFVTFMDILVVLIGEPLTTSILSKAWDPEAAQITSKELSP